VVRLGGLLTDVGLDLVDAVGVVYADIGSGSFWVGAAESYCGLLASSGLLPVEIVEGWQASPSGRRRG
jgi:hypothetical protein